MDSISQHALAKVNVHPIHFRESRKRPLLDRPEVGKEPQALKKKKGMQDPGSLKYRPENAQKPKLPLSAKEDAAPFRFEGKNYQFVTLERVVRRRKSREATVALLRTALPRMQHGRLHCPRGLTRACAVAN